MSGANAAEGNPQAGTPEANPTPVNPQAGEAGANASAANPQAGTAASGNADPNAQSKMSLEDALSALEKARLENAQHRTSSKAMEKRLAELEAKEQEAENAKLSETERLKKQLAEAQAREAQTKLTYRERVLNAEIRAAARDAGVNPALAARLVDLAQVEDDEEGNPKNIADLLSRAIAEYGITPNAANTNTAATAQNQRQQQTAMAGQAMGATNAQRAAGPLIITPNQYLDPAFRSEFLKTHGTDLLKAVNAGKVKIT